MVIDNPRAAKVSVFGDWGSAEDIVYENWEESDFDIPSIKARTDLKFAFGLDFGFKVSYNALVALAYDPMTRSLWIYDEMYFKGESNLAIAKEIIKKGYGKEKIWADSAEPKSIYELREGFIEERDAMDGEGKEYVRYILPNIVEAIKGPDSVRNGIARVQEYHMYVHYTCRNMIRELTNYSWKKDKDGNFTGEPEKEFDHLCDALRYALTGELIKGRGGVIEARGDEMGVKDTVRTVYVPEGPQNAVTAQTEKILARLPEPVNTLMSTQNVISAEGPADVAPPRKKAVRVFSSIRYD